MRGRIITIEYVGTRMPFKEYAISCESHDAYLYLADSIEEAVESYEEDRHCTVLKAYDYDDGSVVYELDS